MTNAPLLRHPEIDPDVADWLGPRMVLWVLDSLSAERPEHAAVTAMPPAEAAIVREALEERRLRAAALRERLAGGERMSLASIAAEAGVPLTWLADLIAEGVREIAPMVKAAEAETRGIVQ